MLAPAQHRDAYHAPIASDQHVSLSGSLHKVDLLQLLRPMLADSSLPEVSKWLNALLSSIQQQAAGTLWSTPPMLHPHRMKHGYPCQEWHFPTKPLPMASQTNILNCVGSWSHIHSEWVQLHAGCIQINQNREERASAEAVDG